jgi:hypothetical protein
MDTGNNLGLAAVGSMAVHAADEPLKEASDVAFGAALGMQSARVVTIRFRELPVSIAPVAVAGSGAIQFSVRADS